METFSETKLENGPVPIITMKYTSPSSTFSADTPPETPISYATTNSISTAATLLHPDDLPVTNNTMNLDMKGPVFDFYRHKGILLTGVTGFVGKAVLWKLISSLGESMGKIYVLIRSGGNKRHKLGRPADRIQNEIIQNKASASENENKTKKNGNLLTYKLGICIVAETDGIRCV
ncbi:hypothetical protein DFQ30_008902 [Apophysomyces sp. BC1015]|nr:hypothetical protein DFQ30_008902 [Apophysomyces sp. BC1015]